MTNITTLPCCSILVAFFWVFGNDHFVVAQGPVSVSGDLQQWHKVTLNIDGPEASEDGDPNPFTDYRLNVTFVHPKSGLSYTVPGYFAADGDAANTSASSGNQWRVHLAPDHTGQWDYSVSFRKGSGVAVSDDAAAGEPIAPVDGLKGSFEVRPTDKSGRDFRGKGRLDYVGKHHLKFAGDGEFFLKAGVDAPENLLAYSDFDGDFATDGHKDKFVKNWQPHVQDWKDGDPSWKDGKGKGLIGAVNYLASQGLNVFSFLTLNIGGDDRNVFPYTNYDERARIDCSKMDQWEIVFSHGDKLGMYLHFKTQECEIVNLLDNGELGPQRKLYYRELIARFGHHLALNWNLGEEVGLRNKVSTEKKVAWANYFAKNDPYHHHIVIHNGDNHYDLLGDASALTGFSLQTNKSDFRNVHRRTIDYLRRSVAAGKPWVVACDEPGDASHSLIPDAENPNHDNARQNALWGNLMAGGAGVEWYFGYKHAHSDLTCQDFRARENMWKQSRIALDFFREQKIPFWDMSNANDMLLSDNGYCLANNNGALYLVYAKQASETSIDLTKARGVFEVQWFDPRGGGSVQAGSVEAVKGGGKFMLGQPPSDADRDWVAMVKAGAEGKTYASFGAPAKARPDEGNAAFEFKYDPTQAKKVALQTDGVLVVEAEDFDAVDREDHRKWYLTTADKEPGIKPDPDPNHADGASGGAYLELLPDTRRTHSDPLVNGVSFTNKAGQCSVLYYPVKIETAGRYFVWVRMCCTGSEDNGLHVGLDGKWPASGQRLQFTGHHGKWQWDSRQRTKKVHTGVLGKIWLDIDKPGLHTIMFSMREDGFEFDKFMLTKKPKAMKSKSLELGPEASPVK